MIDKFKNNIGGIIGFYVFFNLAFTTFSGYQIKTYDISRNQIITKPRQINLGNFDDKWMPFLYPYGLTHHSEILFKNGDRVELNKRISFLETCLCKNCSKKIQISPKDILYYYNKNENKIKSGISLKKYAEFFPEISDSFCGLNPVFPKKDKSGLTHYLKID